MRDNEILMRFDRAVDPTFPIVCEGLGWIALHRVIPFDKAGIRPFSTFSDPLCEPTNPNPKRPLSFMYRRADGNTFGRLQCIG